jgi:hypothetical protein
MVLAIRFGWKTMTRRTTHDNGDTLIGYEYVTGCPTYPATWKGKSSEPYTGWAAKFSNLPLAMPRICPYGQLGDVLWVREEHYAFGWWEDIEGEFTETGKQKTQFVHTDDPAMSDIYFADTLPSFIRLSESRGSFPAWHRRPGMFMPAKYARLFLEVTAARVERIQEITEADCIAEGVTIGEYPNNLASVAFVDLWMSVNGKRSWLDNPWVWAVSFKNVEKSQNFPI